MKVIFISRENIDMPAVRVRCFGFARFLEKAGIDTQVFSFAQSVGAKSGKEEAKMNFFEKLKYNFEAYLRLAPEDAVLILQRCNYHSLAPLLLKFFKKKKLVLDLDDWEARENTQYYFNKLPNSKAEIAMQLIAKSSIFCIGASKFLVDYLANYNRKVVYISTAVDTDFFKPGNNIGKHNGITVSWLGTIYRKDNIENINFLMECFEEISDSSNDVSLEIAGDGLYVQDVLDLVTRKKKRNIRFKSWITPDEVPAYLDGIDIGVMPLIQDTKFNKAKSPTRLFEYMAMGKPVLASRIGEASLIINDSENGFLAGSKKEFKDKLKILIKEKKLRHDLGVCGRNTVLENYSLEKNANKLVEALKML
ncbi:MAG: glycosyltransferase [Candidatus Omnitrophica bacterium]|nr:glycosyltransferase [Candidatus Omnitrophota bacterium]